MVQMHQTNLMLKRTKMRFVFYNLSKMFRQYLVPLCMVQETLQDRDWQDEPLNLLSMESKQNQ